MTHPAGVPGFRRGSERFIPISRNSSAETEAPYFYAFPGAGKGRIFQKVPSVYDATNVLSKFPGTCKTRKGPCSFCGGNHHRRECRERRCLMVKTSTGGIDFVRRRESDGRVTVLKRLDPIPDIPEDPLAALSLTDPMPAHSEALVIGLRVKLEKTH